MKPAHTAALHTKAPALISREILSLHVFPRHVQFCEHVLHRVDLKHVLTAGDIPVRGEVVALDGGFAQVTRPQS